MARQRIAVVTRSSFGHAHSPLDLAHYLEIETNLKRQPGQRPRVPYDRCLDLSGHIRSSLRFKYFLNNQGDVSRALDWFNASGKPKSPYDTAMIVWRIRLLETLRHFYINGNDGAALMQLDLATIDAAIEGGFPALRALLPSLHMDGTRNHLIPDENCIPVARMIFRLLREPEPTRTDLEMAGWNMENAFEPDPFDPFDEDQEDDDDR